MKQKPRHLRVRDAMQTLKDIEPKQIVEYLGEVLHDGGGFSPHDYWALVRLLEDCRLYWELVE